MTTKRHDLVPSPGFSEDDSAPASNLSSMQRAIVTIQKLRTKVESLERARSESIAIVGMGCRFPGGANTPEAFFRLLDNGVDAVSEVPPERWLLERESADSEGEQRSLRWGAFLKDVDKFDAAFFGISPREAESLDPQQRLLLEVTWEALERAGQLPERLMGSKTGVFVGIWSLDYQQRVIAQEQDKLDAYCFTGNVLSTAAGRLAYTLGLQGPCMSVETACSSSLTAIHLACQSLRAGESSMALAGGVNLMLSPTTTKLLSKTQALSPDGRCKTFDARANGFVRGEGCGILVLKRLSDAERDGDTILALIRGSAVNQDGRSTGLTAPNVLSQQALLRQALENARLSPQDIGYVETHGTGTSLGDPIEMEAIKAVLGAPREKGSTCILGAVKTNIGHLEAAAGVAGVIKVVLAMQNDKIPGNLHFRSLNPRIDLKGTSLEIAQEAKPWTSGIRPRCAGVSSFGISGTNAHIILEEAPRNLEEALLEEEASTCLLPLSAKTPDALRDLARAFHEMLISAQSPRLTDIVHTASARRSHYLHRLAVVGSSREEVARQLAGYLDDNAPTGVARGQSIPGRAKVVFVFSGQGSQWLGMGRQLYESDSSFRSVIDTCDNLMTARLGWSLLDELDSTEAMSRMSETQVAQPLLFAVQIALVEMLRSWGIAPDAMIGHSVGEIAAAHIAGILSLDEAIRLVSLRGRIMQKATGMGKMVSVSMSPDQARTMIEGYEDRVSIAAINDPTSVVLAGAAGAIDDIVVKCEKQGFTSRPVRVNYAFHSPQMDPFERELVDRLVRVDTRRATLAMYSTVLADCVDGKELDVRYWGRNIRETVDFAGAVSAAVRDGYQLFLEIGPHPVLTSNIQNCFNQESSDFMVTYTMRRNVDQRRTLLEAIGALYTRGCTPEWARVIPGGGKCVSLPTNPWLKERYWIQESASNLFASMAVPPAQLVAHPLLGTAISLASKPNLHIWQRTLSLSSHAWIAGHVVQDMSVFPGAGYIEMALAAAHEISPSRSVVIEDLAFERMLALSKEDTPLVQVLVDGDEWNSRFTVSSQINHGSAWTRHASGQLHIGAAIGSTNRNSLDEVRERCGHEVPVSEHYARLEQRDLIYADLFRSVKRILLGTNEALAQVVFPAPSFGDYRFHPALLDGCLQIAALLAIRELPAGPILPVHMKRMALHRDVERTMWIHARVAQNDEGTDDQIVDITIWSEQGQSIAEIAGFAIRRLGEKSTGAESALDPCFYRLMWRQVPASMPNEEAERGTWVIVGPGGALDDEVGNGLRQQNQQVIRVHLGKSRRQIGPDSFAVDTSEPRDFQQVFSEIFKKESRCSGVVFLQGVHRTQWQETTGDSVERDLRTATGSALHTVQAILRTALRDPPRLWFVTQGAQRVDSHDDPSSIPQAALWGMARSIMLEHPELDFSRIDLDTRTPASAIAAQLVHELLHKDRNDQVALRPHGRFAARLARASVPRAALQSIPIRQEASYLVTGGLGGLGFSVARWLVMNGARHLVLVGRSEPNETTRNGIRELENAGARVTVIAADISREIDVETIFSIIDSDCLPLRGIVHAAAVVADHTVLESSADEMASVLGPKAVGAFRIHSKTTQRPLDFFILYSSVVGLIGSPGQTNYSGANAALDAVAQARHAAGLPALSIQWGPFRDVGLAAAKSQGKRLGERGLESFSPEEGVAALSRVSSAPTPEIAVFRFDVRRWLEAQPQAAASALWDELLNEQDTPRKGASKAAAFLSNLQKLPVSELKSAIEQHVGQLLSIVLHIEPQRLDINATLAALGMDSMTSLELRNRLEASLDLRFPATLLFTYPTAAAVIKHVVERIAPGTVPESPAKEAPITSADAAVEEELALDDDLLAAFDASMTTIKDKGLL